MFFLLVDVNVNSARLRCLANQCISRDLRDNSVAFTWVVRLCRCGVLDDVKSESLRSRVESFDLDDFFLATILVFLLLFFFDFFILDFVFFSTAVFDFVFRASVVSSLFFDFLNDLFFGFFRSLAFFDSFDYFFLHFLFDFLNDFFFIACLHLLDCSSNSFIDELDQFFFVHSEYVLFLFLFNFFFASHLYWSRVNNRLYSSSL